MEYAPLICLKRWIAITKHLRHGKDVFCVLLYIQHSQNGVSHSEGDLALHVMPDNIVLTGDLIFEGRIPFVGSANMKTWLEKLRELETSEVKILISGHGATAKDPATLISHTSRYLEVLREQMGETVNEWIPFDETYDAANWDEFIEIPAFPEANRNNAYGVYLSLQREFLQE